ncbi:MAG: DUF5343 domain-containing protein [Chloroflexota bacterium]|nr:DUF5343 domain-containing protein [Chloroflexota bacterium]
MIDDKSRKRLPPYVSYRTFRNFIDGLQEVTPARIDRSYWGDRLSGSTGTQLMAALRFLGLVDANGIPTARLKGLAAARGEHRNELLREMTTEAFGFLTLSSFDMQTATSAQLQEVFHYTFQLTGDVGRKCIKFFVALASDAGMPLSPFITKRFRISHGNTGTKTATRRSTARTSRSAVVPQSMEEVPLRKSWDEMLITKFPTFDPTWSDEVKLKWFEAFDELLKRGLVKG